MVSRICNQLWWQVGSSCFTNDGRFLEFRTSGFSRDKSAGPWNTQELNNRDTIHFNGEYCNIDLLYRTVHSANQLCIYGAVTMWCGKNSGEAQQTRKYSQDISRNSNKAGGSQVIGEYSKTTASVGKPNAPEFERFQVDVIYVQY